MKKRNNRILEWRKHRGLTLEQLAEKVDASVSMISRLQNEERSLDLDWMIKFAAVFNCSPSELLSPELQKNISGNVDEIALEKALTEIIGVSQSVKDLILKEKAQLIINRYQQIIENK